MEQTPLSDKEKEEEENLKKKEAVEENTSNRLKAAALIVVAASTISSALSNLIHLATHFAKLKGGIGLPIFTLIIDLPVFIYCQYVTWREYSKMKNVTLDDKKERKAALGIGIAEGIGLAALSIGDLSTIFWPVAFTIAGPSLTIVAFSIFTALAIRDLVGMFKKYKHPEFGPLTEEQSKFGPLTEEQSKMHDYQKKMQRAQMGWKVGSILGCLGVVVGISALMAAPVGLPIIVGFMLGFGVVRVVSSLSTPVEVVQPTVVPGNDPGDEKSTDTSLSTTQAPIVSTELKKTPYWKTAAKHAIETLFPPKLTNKK
jgi:hypothetical protein